jgi:hypothetical protein
VPWDGHGWFGIRSRASRLTAMKRGMRQVLCPMRWGDRLPVAALLLPALLASGFLASGCSSNSVNAVTTAAPPTAAAPPLAPAAPAGVAAAGSPAVPPPTPPAPSLKDKISGFFSNKSADTPQAVANAQPDVDCPFIDIRQGAATLTIPPPPPDGSNEAMTLRYQGTFVRAARECKVLNGQMVMNVGVQGRVIVGPAGGPGQVEVPLRFAVVSAPTAGSRTVVTKLVRIPVTVPNQDGATFTHIEEGLSFPLPPSSELASYIVYIGFDPIGAAADEQQKRPAVKPKPKLKPNPSAPTG